MKPQWALYEKGNLVAVHDSREFLEKMIQDIVTKYHDKSVEDFEIKPY